MQAGGQEFESLHLHSSERMPIGFTGDDSMQKKLCVMMAGKTVRKEWKAIPEKYNKSCKEPVRIKNVP